MGDIAAMKAEPALHNGNHSYYTSSYTIHHAQPNFRSFVKIYPFCAANRKRQ
jgi:hypothetical protein